MPQTYECPNCRALVSPGESYCGYCGFRLKKLPDRMPPPASLPVYTCHNTAQFKETGIDWPAYQQPVQAQSAVKAGHRPPEPVRIAATRELHSNIIKLLDDMLTNRKSN